MRWIRGIGEDALLQVVRLNVLAQSVCRFVNGPALVTLVRHGAKIAERGTQISTDRMPIAVRMEPASGAQMKSIAHRRQIGRSAVGRSLTIERRIVAVVSVGFRRSIGIFHHRADAADAAHSTLDSQLSTLDLDLALEPT